MVLFEKISQLPIVFGKVLDTRSVNYHFFQNGHGFGNGMEYLTESLLLVPLVFCLYFYFIQAKNLANATRNSYLTIFLIGLFTLVVVDFVLMATVVHHGGVFADGNMYRALGVSLIWFCILYQLYSWLVKGLSNVPYIDLWHCFFGK